MGAGLRPGAKAPEEPPDPTGGAPALDPTGERGEETCPRDSACGPVAKAPDKPPTPTGYAPLLDSTDFGARVADATALRRLDVEGDGRHRAVAPRPTTPPAVAAGAELQAAPLAVLEPEVHEYR